VLVPARSLEPAGTVLGRGLLSYLLYGVSILACYCLPLVQESSLALLTALCLLLLCCHWLALLLLLLLLYSKVAYVASLLEEGLHLYRLP
jgi:uncharacterized protein with PQ loop repeat